MVVQFCVYLVLFCRLLSPVSTRWSKVVWGARTAHLECELPGAKGPADLLKPSGDRKVPQHLAMLEPANKATESAANISWLWWRDGVQVKSERVTLEGALDLKSKRNEGNYSCALKGAAGTVRGYDTSLRFASMANNFIRHPSSQAGHTGQPLILGCEIESKPPANITWEKDDVEIKLGDRFQSIYNGQLIITNLMHSDSGNYRCIATNTQLINTKVRMSNYAKVEVSDVDVGIMPHFLNAKVPDTVLLEGSSLSLPCLVVANPKVKIKWEFIKQTDNTISAFGSEEILKLQPLKVEDSGTYQCSLEGNSNMNKQYQVRILRPPKLILRPNNTSIQSAGKVRFNCTASGYPPPTIRWLKDGVPLAIEGNKRILNASFGDVLLVTDISPNDAGVYQCIAENEAGIDSDWAMLRLWSGSNEGPPPKGLICYPLSATELLLEWEAQSSAVAYTVHLKMPGEQETKGLVGVDPSFTFKSLKPYMAYNISLRAYKTNQTSQLTPDIECSGQGVPITIKSTNDGLTATWIPVPNAVGYRLQGRKPGGNIDMDVQIGPELNSYTIKDQAAESDYELRLLVTLTDKWLDMDLRNLSWYSLKTGSFVNPQGTDQTSCQLPTDLKVDDVSATGAHVSWSCDGGNGPYELCYKMKQLPQKGECVTTEYEYFDLALQPDTEYLVTVQVHGKSGVSQPLFFRTKDENKPKNVGWQWVDGDLVLTWSRLTSPANEDQSSTEEPTEVPNWPDNQFTVFYSQNISNPLNKWELVNVTNDTQLRIHGIQPVQTYVLICAGALPNGVDFPSTNQKPKCVGQTVAPPSSSRSYGIYIAAGACAVCVLVCILAAVLWRRRKTRAATPAMRHSELAANDTLGNWEAVDVKGSTSSCRNGGNGRSVDEPLLNGHVNTLSPRNTTANGSIYSDIIDVSRRPDVTWTTLLSASPATPHKSRDDNMNCQTALTPT